MSTKERDRWKVLHEVKRGHWTQRSAAGQLGISDRWVRKLLVRIENAVKGGKSKSRTTSVAKTQ